MDENKKEHHLHIVLTTQQYQLLCCQAKECRLTKRAYLARLIEGRPVKARPTKEIKELRTEIHHIGNNINQIARRLNEHDSIYETEMDEIVDEQKGLKELLSQLLQRLGHDHGLRTEKKT